MTSLPFTWDGDAMVPVSGFRKRADREFVVGKTYRLEETQERSMATHNHEFAWLRDAWMNLPEDLADRFPTPEHLRKAALIEAGYFHETIIDAGTNAAALRVASYARAKDEFSHVVVRGPIVVERTAKSQRRRTMPGKEFQQSKTAIMEVIANLIGVKPEQLQNAEAA